MSTPSSPIYESSQGSASSWVLEHLLTYPGTYEIPLRTMYTLNATTQAQQSPNSSFSHVPGNAFPPRPSHVEEGHALNTHTAAAQLRANLISHISQQPSQPTSLPPSFVTSFVRRCFPVELDAVDFPQALTALDYLKDLEVRRRREVVAALNRLGVDKNDYLEKEKLGKKYPGVLRWIIDVEEKERRVEALYTQVYLGLRRWVCLLACCFDDLADSLQTLINEMSLQPFNKSNCLAMLNTLYPPVSTVQPTAQLTNEVLAGQRNGFFRYIQNVEKAGPELLRGLIDQGKSPAHETGWVNVRDTVDRYLRSANAIIDECYEILGRESVGSPTTEHEAEEQRPRKVDSGISFNSTKRLSSRASTSTSGSTKDRSFPSPTMPESTGNENNKPAGSTLERIARELRRIKSRGDIKDGSSSGSKKRDKSRTRVTENEVVMTDEVAPQKERKLRLKPSLKKMRSISALGERDRNITSSGSSVAGRADDHPTPEFDVEEMRERRRMWETRQKANGSFDSMEMGS